MQQGTPIFGSIARSGAAAAVVACLIACSAGSASAQQALPELPLEELIRIDSGRVFGASDRMQLVTEAPASVSFITADEIARQGYRTLADILRGVRGLYVTNDRNFSFLGARGFGQPGDYNSRVLLLVNGHRVNDNVFGQAEIGAEFGMDPAIFERVEIIRGPASSLYGDSAFFAVVNVITKSGAAMGGTSLSVEGGTLGTGLVRAGFGRQLSNGLEVAFSGTFEGSRGVQRLYFPAFDSPATNNGIAEGLDGENVGAWYGQAKFKNFTVTATYGRRRRDVPTASFGTAFNEQLDRESTVDRHGLADLEYAKPVGNGKLSLRWAYDRFTYSGEYPFAPAVEGDPVAVAENVVLGHRWTGTAKLIHPLPGRQMVTVGTQYFDNIAQNQRFGYRGDADYVLDREESSKQIAVFAQDEIRLTDHFLVNLGVRRDHYELFDRTTPRMAFIASTSSAQSFKYLFGRAFRAPNAYELNTTYFGDGVLGLRPEAIDTHEVVWERYTNDWLRTSVAGYWYRADRLITLIPDEETFLASTYVNQAKVRARGLELEAQMRLPRGVQGAASYAVQRALDSDTDRELTNSPRQTATVRLSVPAPRSSNVSGELLVVGRRLSLTGQEIGTLAVANVSVTVPLSRSVSLFGNVRNLLDHTYSDPASSAHIQDLIQQNGRTARIGLRWRLPDR